MNISKKRVVITGLGAVCPVGNDVASSWDSIINGRSGIERICAFDPSELKTQISGEVKGFDPLALFGPREARRMDRFTQLALAAAQEAVQDAKLQIEGVADRIGAVIGTGIGGVGTLLSETYRTVKEGLDRVSPHLVPMMLPDTAPAKIAIEMGLRGPNMAVVTACASSTNALGEATEMIRRGSADAMVVGGAEAGILPLVIAGFSIMQALSRRNDEPQRASRPFDRDRDGFVAGEGAAVLILESEEFALARGARIYGEVLGYGTSADAYHITAPDENGEGAVLAMRAALNSAGLAPEDIDYINAHGTSTTLNDRAETMAIKTVFGETAYNIPISSTKSMTGHLMGGAGALEALFCVKALETGILPPTINYETPDPECDLDYVPNTARTTLPQVAMSNSFGFGGHNATIILGQYA